MNQRELGSRFASGYKSGKAGNLSIINLGRGRTALVSYGWAVLAIRSPEGQITEFSGWYGYSVSTSCQISRSGIHYYAHRTLNTVPRLETSIRGKGLRV